MISSTAGVLPICSKIPTINHQHPLLPILNYDHNHLYASGFTCDKCNSHFSINYPRWCCLPCNFDVCSNCISAHVFSHPHPLRYYLAKGAAAYQSGFKCDNCLDFNASPHRWGCLQCEYDLCERCFEQQTTSCNTSLHQHSLLYGLPPSPTLATTTTAVTTTATVIATPSNYTCNQCGGLRYGACWFCEFCEVRLCACFQKKLLPAHPHELTLVSAVGKTIYKSGYFCNICRRSFSTGKRWNCLPCQFDVCESCYLLQENQARFCLKIDPNQPKLPLLPPQPQPQPQPQSGAPAAPCDADLCVICMDKSKDSTFVHGTTGHIACCRGCAEALKKARKPCPICRLPIDSVIVHYYS